MQCLLTYAETYHPGVLQLDSTAMFQCLEGEELSCLTCRKFTCPPIFLRAKDMEETLLAWYDGDDID